MAASRAESEPPAPSDCDDPLDRFDAAWQSGAAPRIKDFLPPARAAATPEELDARRRLLIELVKVDLEYRWRRRGGVADASQTGNTSAKLSEGVPRALRLEDYARVFPSLAPQGNFPIDLIGEEYRVRRRFGDQPTHEEYARRFLPLQPDLARELAAVDRQLALEAAEGPADPTVSGDTLASVRAGDHGPIEQKPQPGAAAPVSDAAAIVAGLRDCDLFPAEACDALAEEFARSGLSAQAAADSLVARGLVTPLQAQMLRMGKALDLLLGEYVLLSKLGEGGMGIVYKARHRRMDRTVALKVLDAKIIPSPEALRRFRREVQAAARLHHPNVVLAYDASEDAGRHYLVMEYVDGTNLRRQVRDAGPLPVHEAIDCILQAARGLEYAHSQRVIHRDIKPDNLLRDSQGRVRILDLGLARLGDRMASGAATITSTGSLMGTLEFMAPEQARDAHAADHRADVYSLGCTLHHLLTGRPPYSGESMYEKLSAHQEQPIPSLAAARPDVPPALDGLFRRMLAKEPEDRFQSMTEVIAALEALGSAPQDTSHRKGQTREPSEASDVVATAPRASSGVGDASPGASPRPRPSKPTPPSRWLTPSRRFAPPPAMLLGGVLVVLAALVLWLLFR